MGSPSHMNVFKIIPCQRCTTSLEIKEHSNSSGCFCPSRTITLTFYELLVSPTSSPRTSATHAARLRARSPTKLPQTRQNPWHLWMRMVEHWLKGTRKHNTEADRPSQWFQVSTRPSPDAEQTEANSSPTHCNNKQNRSMINSNNTMCDNLIK